MMGFKFGSGYGEVRGTQGVGFKLQKIREQLKALAAKDSRKKVGSAGTAGGETIADDTQALADREQSIRRDEALVREALALFGADYDALIAPQGKDGKPSVYARALQANPRVAEEVAKDPQPVLAALRVALGYKPFAEFAEKYGETPEDIKAAVKAEVLAEGKGDNPSAKRSVGPVFSTHGGQRVPAGPGARGGLKDIFGK